MPTVTLVTSVVLERGDAELAAVLDALTAAFADCAKVPREYVHIHCVAGALGTFGGSSDAPWAQLRAVVGAGQLQERGAREELAFRATKALNEALGVPSQRAQLMIEPVELGNLAIGGNLLA